MINNNFIFIGRLTKNPELRYTSSNKAVTQIDLAIANTKDDTTFVPITLFEKMAENVCEYCEKGDCARCFVTFSGRNFVLFSYVNSFSILPYLCCAQVLFRAKLRLCPQNRKG